MCNLKDIFGGGNAPAPRPVIPAQPGTTKSGKGRVKGVANATPATNEAVSVQTTAPADTTGTGVSAASLGGLKRFGLPGLNL